MVKGFFNFSAAEVTAHWPSECSCKVCAKEEIILHSKIGPGKAGEGTAPVERSTGPHLSALEFNELQQS